MASGLACRLAEMGKLVSGRRAEPAAVLDHKVPCSGEERAPGRTAKMCRLSLRDGAGGHGEDLSRVWGARQREHQGPGPGAQRDAGDCPGLTHQQYHNSNPERGLGESPSCCPSQGCQLFQMCAGQGHRREPPAGREGGSGSWVPHPRFLGIQP